MPLTEEQKKLYLDLQNAIDKKEDITDLLKKVKKNDFIAVFTIDGTKIKCINEGEKTIDLVKYAAVIDNDEALKAIFNYCRKNSISVSTILNTLRPNVNLSSSTELREVQIDDKKINLVIFNQLKEVGGLKKFFCDNKQKTIYKPLPTVFFEILLECYNESESREIDIVLVVDKLSDKGILKKFISICKRDELKEFKDNLKYSGNYDALRKIYRAEKEIAANKSGVAGAICGFIAALAVGGGCFATGVALPILTLIGIAVAAALVIGLIAGSITYAISSKIENPDTSRLATEQGLPQPN